MLTRIGLRLASRSARADEPYFWPDLVAGGCSRAGDILPIPIGTPHLPPPEPQKRPLVRLYSDIAGYRSGTTRLSSLVS